MAHPPDNKLKDALSYGNIIYSKVSPADINRAQSIYGPDIPALQGNAEPFPVTQESLRDTTEQELYADILMANGLSFFITVAKPLVHIIATPIEGRDIASLSKVVRHHLTCYSQRRISIPIIYSDNERGLAALAPELAVMGIQLIHSGPGMHVHVMERAIRYIKEGVRSVHAGLPYTCPRALFRLPIPFVALCFRPIRGQTGSAPSKLYTIGPRMLVGIATSPSVRCIMSRVASAPTAWRRVQSQPSVSHRFPTVPARAASMPFTTGLSSVPTTSRQFP